ncbi:MAG: 50S ribosomal protein L33 [Bacilli bacterium]|nr:50S ribosomal protein L33 [Bacilli bacterium]
MRKKVILICDECLSRNYETTRPEGASERFTIKKYCPKCKRHTLHKESK